MKIVLAVIVLALTAACGAYSFPGQPAVQTGHVSGQVLVYPCSPVEQAGQSCRGLPGRAIALTFTNGSETHTATTDDSGHYAIDVSAGTWKVTFKGIMRIISGPNPVAVTAGGAVEADYVVDSGIRMPGPPAATP